MPAFRLGIRRQLQHLRRGGRADDDPAIGKSEPEFHPAFSHLFIPRLPGASPESHSARARRQGGA